MIELVRLNIMSRVRNMIRRGILQVVAFATMTVMFAVIISLLDNSNWLRAFHTFILIAGIIGFFIALLAIRVEAEVIAFVVLLGQIASQLASNFLQGQFAPLDYLINWLRSWNEQTLGWTAWTVYLVTALIWIGIHIDFLGIRTWLATRLSRWNQ
jgi:hypothetical protein